MVLCDTICCMVRVSVFQGLLPEDHQVKKTKKGFKGTRGMGIAVASSPGSASKAYIILSMLFY